MCNLKNYLRQPYQSFSLAIALLCSASTAFAGGRHDYKIDENLSSVYFTTVKLQYVVEPAVFNKVSGSLRKSGDVSLKIPLASLDTKVAIRNMRLQELFFQASRFPHVEINAKIDRDKLHDIDEVGKMNVAATIKFYGNTKKTNLNLLVAKNHDSIVVSSLAPTMINANDFGIPASNLQKLAATVGGIPIADTVGVSFVLTFIEE